MSRTSAGLLMYRRRQGAVEVLLGHPGGPYFSHKDEHAWTIPKGEAHDGENLFLAAQREFTEETGIIPQGTFVPLLPIKQKGGKVVYAWAIEQDCNPGMIVSNTFRLEWPPHSGQHQIFPELDRAEFFDLSAARVKIKAGQEAFLDQLADLIALKM